MISKSSLSMGVMLAAVLLLASTLLAAGQDSTDRLLLPVISSGAESVAKESLNEQGLNEQDLNEVGLNEEGLVEEGLGPASVNAYDATQWRVAQKLGISVQSPGAKLDIRYYDSAVNLIGKIVAGTPLGEGVGWILYAPNGHRRDINVFNGGLVFRTSPNANGGPVRMMICEDGKVGIGSNMCPSNILQVVQNSSTDPKADAWTTYSSRTYKKDIQELTKAEYEAALQSVLDTPVVTFRYKGQDVTGKVKIGVIAEEAPEIILAEGDDKAVSLNEYISLLHAAITAQQAQIDDLQAQVDALTASAQ